MNGDISFISSVMPFCRADVAPEKQLNNTTTRKKEQTLQNNENWYLSRICSGEIKRLSALWV